jgi:1-acyl-sn-glycerol-3-phosphate acyltransferase
VELFKNIFARIWAVWGLLTFALTLLIVAPFIWGIGLIAEPRRTEVMRRIFVVWMRIFMTLIGCRVVVKGREHFRKGESYIVTCNHNSLMDVPLSTPQIPGPNKTIAKIEMAKIPVFGLIYKRGSVLVDRKNEESRKNSYIAMKQVLDMGMHVCIYPEGTRNKTRELLQPFHNGAFKLAADTGRPIIPALIFNTGKVLPNNKSFYLLPGTMRMHFLPPVQVSPADTPESLKDAVFTIMKNYYEANR